MNGFRIHREYLLINVYTWNFDTTFFSQQSTQKVTYLVFTAVKINMMQAKVIQKAYH